MAIIKHILDSNRVNLADSIPLIAPFVIQIEPSGFCNLKCAFCPCNDPNSQKYLKKDIMSIETFEMIVRQCEKFDKSIKILKLIGVGEPLLNKNLPKMIEVAKMSGVFEKIEITTNGTLLTPELSDRLISAGLDTIRISLEAIDDERFFEKSGVHTDVENLRSNIRYFYKHKKDCIVYIKTTDVAITTELDKEKFYNEYGSISDFIFIENVVQNWPDFDAKLVSKGKTRYCDDNGTVTNLVCTVPFKYLVINADGEVLPCCSDWKRQLSLGNVHDTPIKEIWNGSMMLALQLKLLKGEMGNPCSICNFPSTSDNDNIDDAREKLIKELVARS